MKRAAPVPGRPKRPRPYWAVTWSEKPRWNRLIKILVGILLKLKEKTPWT